MKQNRGFTIIELLVALALVTIVSSGIFMVFRQTPQQVTLNAALQLQADLRYAQRRAIIEGRRVAVEFDIAAQMYRIVIVNTSEEIRRVYLHNSIRISHNIRGYRIEYLPRGTVSGTGSSTISLTIGLHTEQLTITPATGRVAISSRS